MISLKYFLFLLAVKANSVISEQVSFFQYEAYHGNVHTVDFNDESGCLNLPRNWDNKASSLSTHGNCILAYDRPYCSGEGTRFAPGNNDHGFLGPLRSRISSFQSCRSTITTTTPRGSSNFNGQLTFYDPRRNTYTFLYDRKACFDLPSDWHNRASHVKTGEVCIKFYKRRGCAGDSVLVDPHDTIRAQYSPTTVELTSNIVSFRPC